METFRGFCIPLEPFRTVKREIASGNSLGFQARIEDQLEMMPSKGSFQKQHLRKELSGFGANGTSFAGFTE